MSLLDYLSGQKHRPMPAKHPYLTDKRYRFSSQVDSDLWRGLDLSEQRKSARNRGYFPEMFSAEGVWEGEEVRGMMPVHVALAPGADWAVVRAARELFETGRHSQVFVHVFDRKGKEVVDQSDLRAILYSPEDTYKG